MFLMVSNKLKLELLWREQYIPFLIGYCTDLYPGEKKKVKTGKNKT